MLRLPESNWELLVSKYGKEQASAVALLHDAYMHLLLSSPLDGNKPIRLYRRLSKEIHEDLSGLVRRYGSLGNQLLACATDMGSHPETKVFLEQFADTPVFREYLHYFRTGDATSYRFILTFLVFAKKAELDGRDLETTAFREWIEIEREMNRAEYDPEDLAVLKAVVEFLVDVDNFQDYAFWPKHGPGRVAEEGVDTIEDKCNSLIPDDKLRRTFRSGRFGNTPDVESTAILGSPADWCQRLIGYEAFAERADTPRETPSVLKFVPKDITKMRSICMEPATYMYAQQGVLQQLVSCMNHSRIGKIVDLRDQSLNREYARWGSALKHLDTIDLSAASDRVHVNLVRGIVPRRILYYLLGTRNAKVLLPEALPADIAKELSAEREGRVITLSKFAPMGSALCFPTQCIVFSAVTVASYLMQSQAYTWDDLRRTPAGEIKLMLGQLFKEWSYDHTDASTWLVAPRVYGDDIICDHRVTDTVISLLQYVGLKVNVNKSFTGAQGLRESCGIYALNGRDVTPQYFRPREVDDEHVLQAPCLLSLVEAINAAGDRKYRPLQAFLLRDLRKRIATLRFRAEIPFTEDRTDTSAVFTKGLQTPAITRYNARWQVDQKKIVASVPRGSRFDNSTRDWDPGKSWRARLLTEPTWNEWYGYDQWLRSCLIPADELPHERYQRVTCRSHTLAPIWARV